MNSVSNLCDELKSLRVQDNRSSRRVLAVWKKLESSSNSLGYDILIILEQVFIAAIDYGDEETAKNCLVKLKEKFPDSNRVCRLYGMFLEYKKNFTSALELYFILSKIEPTNAVNLKRIICIYLQQGKNYQAIEELNKLLKVFCVDTEAWSELMYLYLVECDYKKAAFCCEELILNNPENFSHFVRYAEIKYTESGHENYNLAKSYYCQALILNPMSLRAAYGLFMTLSRIMSSTEVKNLISSFNAANENKDMCSQINLKNKKEPNDRLFLWTLSRISEIENLQKKEVDDAYKLKEKALLKSLSKPLANEQRREKTAGPDKIELELKKHFQAVLAKKKEAHETTESQRAKLQPTNESSGEEESSDDNETYEKVPTRRISNKKTA